MDESDPRSIDYNRSIVNQTTINNERMNPSFNVREMTYLLDGGKEITEVCFLNSWELGS